MHRIVDILQASKLVKNRDDFTNFNFRQLFESVIQKQAVDIKYYGTRIRVIRKPAYFNQRTKIINKSQRRLRRNLLNQNIQFVNCGYLKLREHTCNLCGKLVQSLQEKGVDVKLAVDLIANHKKGDSVYIASSDTDLIPAIREAMAKGIEVIYIGFDKHITASIYKSASKTIILRNHEIINHYCFDI